ncbi:MAG TPA: glycosyltransferase family 4 protein [Bryobacteraceae bacterium]
MRLLILDQFSDPGGAQQALVELLPAIRERGWDAAVGMPCDGPLFGQIGALGFETARIDCGPYGSGRKSPVDALRFLSGTPRLARQVRLLVKQEQADLVYVNGPRLLPAVVGLRLPVVFHSHSYITAGLARWIAGEALHRADASVIAACRFVAEPWTRFVPRERVTVIYNGVAGPPRTVERRRAAPRIGCIGRIAPEKGQREFLRAASIIHRALPRCRFTVCGAALFSDARAQRYAAQVRAEAAVLPVEFTGWVADVHAALAGLDLLLVPSTSPAEATTRVILEAYAAGVPVIAFPAGGIPEVVAGLPGLLAETAEQMAAIAIELLTGPAERLALMSEAGKEQWHRRFTLERYHQDVLATIECAARGSAARELTKV